MSKKIGTILMILIICGAAVVAFQHLRFSQRALFVFSAQPQHDRLRLDDGPKGEFLSGNHGNGRPDRPHEMGAALTWQGWLNVLAYLSLWAFCIMATYYVERLLVQRRKRAVC